MKLGVRSILLLVAVILFVIAAMSDDNAGDLIAFGLALFAASFLVDDAGLGLGRGRRGPLG